MKVRVKKGLKDKIKTIILEELISSKIKRKLLELFISHPEKFFIKAKSI